MSNTEGRMTFFVFSAHHTARIIIHNILYMKFFLFDEGDPLERKPRFSLKRRGVSKRSVLALFFVAILITSSQATGAPQDRTIVIENEGTFTYSSDFLQKDAQRTIFTPYEEEGVEWVDAQELREHLQKKEEQQAWETELADLLTGHPMVMMIPAMAQRDSTVTAFLIGIAKKESNWGKRVPLDGEGNDCYNYWGYRAPGSLGVQRSGYGCFATPEEAVQVVGDRIETLAIEYKRDTPSEMIVWKCGSSCEGHSAYSVSKWISDVNIYYRKVLALAK